jgi:hypothetical protein
MTVLAKVSRNLNDQSINTVITSELSILNLNNRIRNNRFNWIHHVEGIEPERIPKQLMGHILGGTRSTGLPKFSFKDQSILQGKTADPKVQTLLLMLVKLMIF